MYEYPVPAQLAAAAERFGIGQMLRVSSRGVPVDV